MTPVLEISDLAVSYETDARTRRPVLRGLDLQWPAADFDVAAETLRLAEEDPVR